MHNGGNGVGGDHVVGGEAGHRDREVESGPVFAQGGGREVHRELVPVQRAPGVLGRGAHAFGRFGQGRVGKADEFQTRQLTGDVGLHLHERTGQAHQGDGVSAGQPHQ